jgi:hypothetical protein
MFVLNSTITVCHQLLYYTCRINTQEQGGKIARVKMRVTAYNVPPNFHFVYIVFITVYQLPFPTPHILHPWLAVTDHKWDQKFKAKIHRKHAHTHTHTHTHSRAFLLCSVLRWLLKVKTCGCKFINRK